MTNVIVGIGMAKIIKLLLVVIFLAGCTNGPKDNACNSPDKDAYTIKRAYNGVYVYSDNPKSEDMKIYF